MSTATPTLSRDDLTAMFGDVIHVVTRADLINDGDLVDVADTARKVGYRYPVAMTLNAWDDLVSWTDADENRKGKFTAQDEDGRLHDVLWMGLCAIRRATSGSRVRATVYRVPRSGKSTVARPVRFAVTIGPGDDGRPVLTIMLDHES